MFYIYVIENLINGKVYIGQSVNIKCRWNRHKNSLNNNKHENNYLQKAWDKYGENNFFFYILDEYKTEKEVNEAEIYFIKWYKDIELTYNILPGGENPPSQLGRKHSAESKEKSRQSHLGKKHTEETIEKLIIINSGKNIGKKHSPETKELNRQAQLGKKQSKETIEKRIKANTGKKRSEDFKENQRIAGTGRKHSTETKEKLRIINTGKKQSPESILKQLATKARNKLLKEQENKEYIISN